MHLFMFIRILIYIKNIPKIDKRLLLAFRRVGSMQDSSLTKTFIYIVVLKVEEKWRNRITKR